MPQTCPLCEQKLGYFDNVIHVEIDNKLTEIHSYCAHLVPSGSLSDEQIESQSRIEAIKNIKLTTTPEYPNLEVKDVKGLVTAECAFGMNIFRDFFAGIRDLVGGRSEATQKVLRDARESCLYELKKEAHKIDATGVIGIDLDYSEFSGGGKSMLFLVASGTAVTFKEDINTI